MSASSLEEQLAGAQVQRPVHGENALLSDLLRKVAAEQGIPLSKLYTFISKCSQELVADGLLSGKESIGNSAVRVYFYPVGMEEELTAALINRDEYLRKFREAKAAGSGGYTAEQTLAELGQFGITLGHYIALVASGVLVKQEGWVSSDSVHSFAQSMKGKKIFNPDYMGQQLEIYSGTVQRRLRQRVNELVRSGLIEVVGNGTTRQRFYVYPAGKEEELISALRQPALGIQQPSLDSLILDHGQAVAAQSPAEVKVYEPSETYPPGYFVVGGKVQVPVFMQSLSPEATRRSGKKPYNPPAPETGIISKIEPDSTSSLRFLMRVRLKREGGAAEAERTFLVNTKAG